MRPGFPNIHGATHHQQEIIRGERWNGLAPVQHDNVNVRAALAQEIAKQSGRLVIHVLEHKGFADHFNGPHAK